MQYLSKMWLLVMVLATAGSGCNTDRGGAVPSSPSATGSASPAAPAASGSAPGSGAGVAGAMVGVLPTGPAPSAPPPLPEGAVAAKAGVAAKGRSLDAHEGVIVTPAKTLFAAKERVVFDIAVPQALQLYKATNGQGPTTHDEFMQRVIAENNIQLPALPAGQRYQYDPPSEQLMVVR